MYITEEISETDHKDVLNDVPCHSLNIFKARSLSKPGHLHWGRSAHPRGRSAHSGCKNL